MCFFQHFHLLRELHSAYCIFLWLLKIFYFSEAKVLLKKYLFKFSNQILLNILLQKMLASISKYKNKNVLCQMISQNVDGSYLMKFKDWANIKQGKCQGFHILREIPFLMLLCFLPHPPSWPTGATSFEWCLYQHQSVSTASRFKPVQEGKFFLLLETHNPTSKVGWTIICRAVLDQ